MLNRVVLVGRMVKDADLRFTPNGVAVANFTIAVNRPFTNQQGEREVDFVNCVVWRKPAENLAQYMGKGSLIGVDGRVQTRNFEGQDGKRVYITEVVADSVQFLETKGNNQQPRVSDEFAKELEKDAEIKNDDPFENNGKPIDISDSDLPF